MANRFSSLLLGTSRLCCYSLVRMLLRILIKGCLVGLVFFSVIGVIGYLARAHVYKDTLPHPQTWKEFVFTIVGGLDAASVMYAVVVRLFAALFLGGLVTSLFFALAKRIGEMKLQGLLPLPMKGHYIVAGFGPRTVEVVGTILNPPHGGDLAEWNPTETPPVAKPEKMFGKSASERKRIAKENKAIRTTAIEPLRKRIESFKAVVISELAS